MLHQHALSVSRLREHAMADVTKRIESNDHDLHLLRVREEIADLSRQLRDMSPPSTSDNTARAKCIALERKLDDLRKELIEGMKKTDRIG
jgi:hypothetical protein